MKILEDLTKEIVGQLCCRLDIRNNKSFSFGLGTKCAPKHQNSCVDFYGFWEIETYNASWRIIKNNKILLASESECDFNIVLPNMTPVFNEVLEEIQELTEFDVRFKFSKNLFVDFLTCYTDDDDDDEMLHIMRDDGFWWEKKHSGEWRTSKN